MSTPSLEVRYLRSSVLLLIGCLLFGAGVAGYSYWRWQGAQLQNKQAISENAAVKSKLARASQEELELKEKIGRYLQLKQLGYIGPEKRLDWIEQLAMLRRERKLSDLQYELTPQHPVEKFLLPSGAEAGGHSFQTSTLKLTTSLLHEGDLVQLLADINAKIPAYASVRSCNINHQTGDDRSLRLRYTLKAECTVELITLREQGT